MRFPDYTGAEKLAYALSNVSVPMERQRIVQICEILHYGGNDLGLLSDDLIMKLTRRSGEGVTRARINLALDSAVSRELIAAI